MGKRYLAPRRGARSGLGGQRGYATPSGPATDWRTIPLGKGFAPNPSAGSAAAGTPFLMGKSVHYAGTGATTITISAGITGGKILAAFSHDGDASNIDTVVDSTGNTYALVVRQTDPTSGAGTGMVTELWCADGTLATSGTLTFSSEADHGVCHVYGVAGVATGVPAAGKTTKAKGANDAPTAGATVSSAAVGDLVFGVTHWNGDIAGPSATGGSTQLDDDISDFFLFIQEQATQYRDAAAAVSQAVSSADTSGTNPSWQIIGAIFSAGGGGGSGTGHKNSLWMNGGIQ